MFFFHSADPRGAHTSSHAQSNLDFQPNSTYATGGAMGCLTTGSMRTWTSFAELTQTGLEPKSPIEVRTRAAFFEHRRKTVSSQSYLGLS